uniref:glycosyltransferase n=1 Tax=Rosenbergiella epipactidis TaxID=1544694 RepID=UPI001F4EDBBA
VIAIGRLDYQKNFSRLIDIWSKTQTYDWKLEIIGSGKELPILEDKIKNLNISSINIIPATRDIESYYKKASLVLMSSRYEGLPMVLIEAKNFGLPVIAFDCKTGPREIIENDGYLINYNEDDDFSNKLNLLLKNASLRESFSKNAILNSNKYSTKAILSQWNELING